MDQRAKSVLPDSFEKQQKQASAAVELYAVKADVSHHSTQHSCEDGPADKNLVFPSSKGEIQKSGLPSASYVMCLLSIVENYPIHFKTLSFVLKQSHLCLEISLIRGQRAKNIVCRKVR